MFTKEELVEIQQVLEREIDYVKKWARADSGREYLAKLEALEEKTLGLITDINKAEEDEKADREFYYQLHHPKNY